MFRKSIFVGAVLSALAVPFVCHAEPVRVPPKLDIKNHCTMPIYPARARKLGQQGVVVFELLIDPNGAVQDSRIINSSGSDDLDNAALSGLSQCHYLPGQVDGQTDPNPVWMRLTYTWKIANAH